MGFKITQPSFITKTTTFTIMTTVFLLLLVDPSPTKGMSSYHVSVTGGRWALLQETLGISAMHMQLLPDNTVVMFDRTDFGPSNLSLPASSPCRLNDAAVRPRDCTAHSLLYDVVSNTFRPLTVLTNTFCSSGSLRPDGSLVQTGGDRHGDRLIRTFSPFCAGPTCDWFELPYPRLLTRRWYSTDQVLPDGRVIVVGGRRAFTYEFFPKDAAFPSRWDNFTLPFLVKTRDPQEENNLYPFLHLLPDGYLFIFANNRSISFDYAKNRVVREFPVMPGGDRRNYPSTGSSVLLTLRLPAPEPEVMVCGGAPAGSYLKATYQRLFVEASRTCGRIRVFDPNPDWVMEVMPIPRVMNDMILLPTGDVLLINGAGNGTAGWNNGRDPVLNPVVYLPEEEPDRRFVVLNPTATPRMYHSTAALMPDGSILVAGSNPHQIYNFSGYPYPTELSLEAFYPHYMDPQYGPLKPSILAVESTVSYGARFAVTFVLPLLRPEYSLEEAVAVVLVSPSFATHSLSMNQRMLVLPVVGVAQLSRFAYKVAAWGPTNANVAPPGYYMLFVVHAGIPGHSIWVQLRP